MYKYILISSNTNVHCTHVCIYMYVCMYVCVYTYTCTNTFWFHRILMFMVHMQSLLESPQCPHVLGHDCVFWLGDLNYRVSLPREVRAKFVCVCVYIYIYYINLDYLFVLCNHELVIASAFRARYAPSLCACVCIYIYILHKFGLFVCVM